MFISELSVSNFRKFKKLSLQFGPRINIIIGPNASGKTSILEALYLVSHGKSSRTSNLNAISHNNSKHFKLKISLCECLYNEITYNYFNGRARITTPVKPIINRSQLTNDLCVRLINDKSFRIIESGPKYLRSFIDWQLFHHNITYIETYKSFEKCKEQLKCLTRTFNNRQIKVWLDKYLSLIKEVTEKRNEYLNLLRNEITHNIDNMPIFKGVKISFDVGYTQSFINNSYLEFLNHKNNNLRYFPGPHRAKINFLKSDININNLFSRGQLKIFMISLQIIVNNILYKITNTKGIILIDDLQSELDPEYQKHVASLLATHDFQYFLTSTDPQFHKKLPITKKMHIIHQLE